MAEETSDRMRRFNYLISETNAAYHSASVKLGLSESTSAILYTLCNYNGRCLLGDIIKLSGMSKQTVNSALRRLEAENAVTLETESGRRKAVRLTEKGRTLTENTVARLMRIEDEIFAGWSREDLEAYFGFEKRYLDEFIERTKNI